MKWSRKEFIRLLGLGGLAGCTMGGKMNSSSMNLPLIKPPRIKKGDTIGLISPASILPPSEPYSTVIQSIRDLGFAVKLGKHYKDQYGSMAGTDEHRAEDLNTMFADPEVQAIIPFRGGWGSNRILDFIDFGVIKSNPKPLIGFSDITTLLLSIYAKTGMVTFHGPVAKSDWTAFTTEYFNKAVMGNQPYKLHADADMLAKEESTFYTINPGKATGKIMGGNLSVLTSMMGSDYLPDWEGNILFVEDVGEDVYRIDRMITQLKLNGVLNKLNGFIFGQCTDCNKAHKYSLGLEQVLQDHIKPLKIPSFHGSMIGHISNMFTIPIGIQASMDTGNGTVQLLEVPTSIHG